MAVDTIKLELFKPKYSPLEELVFDVTRAGTLGSGDGAKFTFKLYRNLNADISTDPLLITDEGDFDADKPTVSFILDLRERDTRESIVRTTENGKFKVRGIIGKFYATVEVKDNSAVKDGGPGTTDIKIVPVSPYEFRTSYLPERLLYNARITRKDLDPIEIETAIQSILKNSLRDNELERALRRAESHILGKLDTAISPRRVITRPDLDSAFKGKYDLRVLYQAPPPGFDEIGREFSYLRTDARAFSTMTIPKVPVIDVERVRAIYLNQVFFEFPKSWTVFDRFGNLNMVPVQGTSSVQFTNAFRAFAPTAAYGAKQLPGYWAIDWTYGLCGLEDEFDDVLELIAYKATAEVLALLGSADKPGIASESRSTGGSSESFAYTQSAIYSLFSADVDFLRKQMPARISSLRQRLHGVELFVV